MSRTPVPPRVPNDAAPAAVADSAAPAPRAGSDEAIVAKPDPWYRAKRYLMAVALVAMGPWFAYDGWKGWPAENQEIVRLGAEYDHANKVHDDARRDELNKNPLTHKTLHSELALNIQKVLAAVLPVLGVLMGVWTARASRGVYRLKGDVLEVPGHPPVDLQYVTEVDRSRWDRKGIALVQYLLPNGKKGWLKLDDFVYLREPTDQIFDRIEKALVSEDGTPATSV